MNEVETLGITVAVALLGALGIYGFYLWWARVKADWDRWPHMQEQSASRNT